jgi:predicted Fe-Mo cluster-binding NifX family protein
MKIGVTSQNFRTITGHAGKARRFLIYEAGPDGAVQELERLDLPLELSIHAFRGQEHPIFDLDILITGGCGEGFRLRLGAQGVRVIATAATDPLQAVADAAAGRPLLAAEPHDHSHEHAQGPSWGNVGYLIK